MCGCVVSFFFFFYYPPLPALSLHRKKFLINFAFSLLRFFFLISIIFCSLFFFSFFSMYIDTHTLTIPVGKKTHMPLRKFCASFHYKRLGVCAYRVYSPNICKMKFHPPSSMNRASSFPSRRVIEDSRSHGAKFDFERFGERTSRIHHKKTRYFFFLSSYTLGENSEKLSLFRVLSIYELYLSLRRQTPALAQARVLARTRLLSIFFLLYVVLINRPKQRRKNVPSRE